MLIAGTNEVDAGRHSTFFKNLEDVLKTIKESSRVLVLSLPARYDLHFNNPFHHSVRLANN